MNTTLNFFYKSARLPSDNNLLVDINFSANKLYKKLTSLHIESLNISDYNKKYLDNHLKNPEGTLQKYCYILSWALDGSKLPLDKFVFIDYGGGSGILSLLAKELGIGTVIYNDIYDVSCEDAEIIGQVIYSEADYYINGDVDDLIGFLRTHSIRCAAIASYDVIEHVYDIEDFLHKISSLSDIPYNIVMSSGANPYNPIIRRKIMKQHLEIEYENREKEWGYKERDCYRAYYDVRRDIILDYVHTLSNGELDYLARSTRGFIKSDILALVEEYLRTDIGPEEPDHPTNTCDPYTGNWAEHLMDIQYLKKILLDANFKVDVKPGYYSLTPNSRIKSLVGFILNPLITLLDDKGLFLAPFFTLYAKKVRLIPNDKRFKGHSYYSE